jgi:hypothetical protein
VIIDLQRRLAEIGRIRIGQQVPTGKGTRPAKLETFRLTSADRTRINLAADLFGGQPRQWDAPAGRQWEVITTVDALDVIVPPSDMAFSQYYELWSAGGCLRRCDGQTESISDGPCVCEPDRRECSIHTRLSVMLANLPGLGVWRVDTSGYYAAVELQGAVEVIRLAAGRGQMLPARLRLEQRAVKRFENGKPLTRRFAVPVLDIEISPAQLMAAPHTDGGARELPAAGNGTALLTPVPETVPTRPTGSIAQQIRQVEQQQPDQPARKNAAQPVPATGLAPRTAAEATNTAGRVMPPHEPPRAEMITPAQLKALQAAFKDIGINDRNTRLEITRQIIGRHINTANQLTRTEASMVLDGLALRRTQLAQQEAGDNPPAIVDMPLPDADTWHGDDDTTPFGDEPKD